MQDDIRSLAGGLVGSETRDPATNRVTGYTPPKYSPDIANTLAQEAYRALNEAYGTADRAPELSPRTGSKDTSGGAGDAKGDVNKLLTGLGLLEEMTRVTGEAYAGSTENMSRPMAWISGNVDRVKARVGIGENAKEIQAANNTLRTMAPQVIRAFGDAGNIPDDQIERVVKDLANPGVQLDVRWDQFQNFLSQ